MYKFQIDIFSNSREIKYQNFGSTHRHTHRQTHRPGENKTSQPPPGRGNKYFMDVIKYASLGKEQGHDIKMSLYSTATRFLFCWPHIHAHGVTWDFLPHGFPTDKISYGKSSPSMGFLPFLTPPPQINKSHMLSQYYIWNCVGGDLPQRGGGGKLYHMELFPPG